MSEITPHVAGSVPKVQPPGKIVSSQYLVKAFRYPKWKRALGAAAWIRGEISVTPTLKLAACVFGVSVPRVKAALERCAKHHAAGTGGDSYPISDAALDRLVAEIGPDRILGALDRVTQPQLPLQAAE
jgi:hypothetical protein